MSDLIKRQDAIDYIKTQRGRPFIGITLEEAIIMMIEEVPSAEPERLTDDDFETIRIHLNAQKEKLCNQQRWEEAEEYQRIIDRFMAFASAEQKTGRWVKDNYGNTVCSKCLGIRRDNRINYINFCNQCGADMREGDA